LTDSRISESFEAVLLQARNFRETIEDGNPQNLDDVVFELSAETERLIFLLEISRGVPYVGSHTVYPEIPDLKEPEDYAVFVQDTLTTAKKMYEEKEFSTTLDELLRARASLVKYYTKYKPS
jgi:hypothetical protein